MPATVERNRSARERLLEAADELFYAGGIHTVGIDTIIERAGVAKASLYSTFGSKEELIRAYLEGRDEARRARVLGEIERNTDPVDRLLAAFDALAASLGRPDFRGCAFANAAAESGPDSMPAEVARDARRWLKELFAGLAGEAGIDDVGALPGQLVLLYDGVLAESRVDCDPALAIAARAAARTLVDAALARADTRR